MPNAGAFYLRLVGRPKEVYQYLEPLYNDYRKVLCSAISANHLSYAILSKLTWVAPT